MVGSLGRNGFLQDLVLYGSMYGRYVFWSITSQYEGILGLLMDRDTPYGKHRWIECVEVFHLDMLEVCRRYSFCMVVVSKNHGFFRW